MKTAPYDLPGDDEACGGCGESYELRHGADDTGFCDTCAQDMVQDALRYREFRHAAYVEKDVGFDAYDADGMDAELDRRIALRTTPEEDTFR